MQAQEFQQSRVRRAVNDLVLAEMFLLQATIESATAIGDGINELGKQISNREDNQSKPWKAISTVIARTADEALEPYTSRFKYLRELISSGS
jgi:hypothetical protein